MTVRCDLCDATLRDETDKRAHLDVYHRKIDANVTCDKCGMKFANEKIMGLHLKLHGLGKSCNSETVIEREILYQEVKKQQESVPDRKASSDTPPKPRRIYRPPSKRVGLTKIRMEDCLRCDACSCIYIDERDYYKHMRNFHEKYNTIIPRTRRKSPTNLRCFTHYGTESHSAFPVTSQQHKENEDKQRNSTVLNIKENIKNRWSKVLSQRLSHQPEIKQELEETDFSPFLCQVEVKIKTEPPDLD